MAEKNIVIEGFTGLHGIKRVPCSYNSSAKYRQHRAVQWHYNGDFSVNDEISRLN